MWGKNFSLFAWFHGKQSLRYNLHLNPLQTGGDTERLNRVKIAHGPENRLDFETITFG